MHFSILRETSIANLFFFLLRLVCTVTFYHQRDKSSKTIWVEDYICVYSEKKAILYKDANAVFTAPSYPQTPVTATMHENLFAIG